MTHRHDETVRRFRRDLETFGNRFAIDDERMITAGGKVSIDAFEDRLTVVPDFDGFPVDRFGCTNDFAAEMLTDRLMPETNTEDGNSIRKALDHFE